jgi:hypothetical protein
MYMVSWLEEEARVEASLGGRVTAEEVMVLAEELLDVAAQLAEQPYLLMLDYGKAAEFDAETSQALVHLKDQMLERGAERIISVTSDEERQAREINERFHNVLAGRESYVLDPIELFSQEESVAEVQEVWLRAA